MVELFDNFCSFMKPFILFAITGIIGAFSPLRDTIYVLNIAFAANIAMGVIADVHVNKAKFNMKKFWEAFLHITLFILFIFIVNETTTRMGDLASGRLCVKWTTYIVVTGYLINILRNAHETWPGNKTIAFLYLIVSTEVVKKIKDMIGIKKEVVTPFEEGKNP